MIGSFYYSLSTSFKRVSNAYLLGAIFRLVYEGQIQSVIWKLLKHLWGFNDTQKYFFHVYGRICLLHQCIFRHLTTVFHYSYISFCLLSNTISYWNTASHHMYWLEAPRAIKRYLLESVAINHVEKHLLFPRSHTCQQSAGRKVSKQNNGQFNGPWFRSEQVSCDV